MHELKNVSVVVTGASSGIGRATALDFARQGACVTLAARRGKVLREIAEECRRAGGEALVVPTDVTDPAAVGALAQEAEQRFGKIDVWVNNAGVGVFGPYMAAPLELHRRTIEVNLFGAVHGAYAVLPHFLQRGRGTLINTISIGAWAPMPYAAAYTASKFGLRGFSASLRAELVEWPYIHVCGVFPAGVDTPGFEHGANVSGRQINPGPMLYAPEDVAKAIVRLAIHPRDEVAVGWPARAAQLAYVLARGPTERLMSVATRAALRRADPAPTYQGGLMHPVPQGTAVIGGWRKRNRVPSAGTLTQIGLAAAGAAFLLGAAIDAMRDRNKNRRYKPARRRSMAKAA